MAIAVRRKLMLLIWKILKDESDADHKLTRKEITERIEVRGYKIGEKEYRTNLDTLCNLVQVFGYEIKQERLGNKHCVWVEKRPFSLPELQIMVDMILSSKFISEQKTIEMIKNLKEQASLYEAQSLQHQVSVQGRVKSMNNSIFSASAAIQEGIRNNKKLSFYYCQWNEKKRLVRKYNGRIYVVSPVGVVFNHENYYLAAYDEKGEERTYRIDKMEEVSVGDDIRIEGLEYSLDAFVIKCRKLFGMFGAKEETVIISCDRDKIGILIDQFGQEITIMPYKEKLKIVVQVEVSDQFLGWMFGIAEFAEIIGNDNAVERYDSYLKKVYELRFSKKK